jgi:hypothetical protein
MKKILYTCLFLFLLLPACKKDDNVKTIHYYQVGTKGADEDWRDSAFVVATKNVNLIKEIDEQLKLPVDERKIVIGGLVKTSGGYNKNASHEFKWRLDENDWQLTDMSIEIYDGRAYSDVDSNLSYWLDTIKKFAPWNSYIAKEVNQK